MVTDKNILVIVAHPDDAESYCGGTIVRLTRGGNHVRLVLCTNGDRGSHDRALGPTDLVRVRQQEQEEAAGILGIEQIFWLGYRDGELVSHTNELRERLIRLIRQQRPDIILTFDPWKHYEFHPDHRSVGFAAGEARMLADLPWICPELTLEGISPWHPAELYLFAPEEANYWVDISEWIEVKIRARLAHRSQTDFARTEEELQDFVSQIKARAGKTGSTCGYAYAEAFHKVDDTNLYI